MRREEGTDAAELRELLDTHVPAIETEMRAVLRDYDPGTGELFVLLRYHLGWVDATGNPCDAPSGKRIRPVLCLLSCEACRGSAVSALPAAAAVELLHNFTLVHDDIEDGDEKRRGRPTLWSIWGQAQGVNAGDALFAVSELATLRLEKRGLPARTVVQAVRLLNETCLTLTLGQYADIAFESCDDVSVDEYLQMIEAKTAALIGCACELGALVAGGPCETRKSLRAFGRHVGLAFQMQDDVLGIWGDPEMTGKPVGTDVLRRKKTLPIVHGLEQNAELRSLLGRRRLSEADVREATDLLEESGSREYTERSAREHFDGALEALSGADIDPAAAHTLRQLANRLVHRDR